MQSVCCTKPFDILHAAPLIKDRGQYLHNCYLARPTATACEYPFELMSYSWEDD